MNSHKDEDRPVVALAGASGFVGSNIRQRLSSSFRWVALTRSVAVSQANRDAEHTEWRHCDLFSLPQVTQALQGASHGIYLVHSMLPSSRLVQGNFADMDILLADNFARAARAAGLKHIIYLGGLLPQGREKLSPHLAGRMEVESVLRQSGVPVTVLRAGLIVGRGGSSTQMLVNLVHRLPLMIMPKWTRSQTQSIDVRDIVRAIDLSLKDPAYLRGTYDMGGHAIMSYREMIMRTAEIMGKRPRCINYPFNSIKISRLWVRLLSGVSAQLVNPLLESLSHNLTAKPNKLLKELEPEMVSFEDSIRGALPDAGEAVKNPRSQTQRIDRNLIRAAKRVRSVQRLPLPKGWDARHVTDAYGDWLPKKFRGLLFAERSAEGVVVFKLRRLKVCLLELTPTPYSREGGLRRAFYITGGLLAQDVDPPGRLEFRLVPDLNCLVAAIHGYAPSLPWWFYAQTQARVHLWVMRSFGRYLARTEPTKDSPFEKAQKNDLSV